MSGSSLLLLLFVCTVSADILVTVSVGGLVFTAAPNFTACPETATAFIKAVPQLGRHLLIQARWSGEAGWAPLGNFSLNTTVESGTSLPAPGQLLFYPHGISETEILFPFGVARFGSKFGPLIGSPFLTIVQGQEQYLEMARRLEYDGAQELFFGLKGN